MSCGVVQNTSFIVGIIIAVICSNWVGEAIHSDGIYETDLEADGSVIFLRPSPPPGLNTKKAIDIACKAVWYVICAVCMSIKDSSRVCSFMSRKNARCSGVLYTVGRYISMNPLTTLKQVLSVFNTHI